MRDVTVLTSNARFCTRELSMDIFRQSWSRNHLL